MLSRGFVVYGSVRNFDLALCRAQVPLSSFRTPLHHTTCDGSHHARISPSKPSTRKYTHAREENPTRPSSQPSSAHLPRLPLLDRVGGGFKRESGSHLHRRTRAPLSTPASPGKQTELDSSRTLFLFRVSSTVAQQQQTPPALCHPTSQEAGICSPPAPHKQHLVSFTHSLTNGNHGHRLHAPQQEAAPSHRFRAGQAGRVRRLNPLLIKVRTGRKDTLRTFPSPPSPGDRARTDSRRTPLTPDANRYNDDHNEYRHVQLPKQMLKAIPKDYFDGARGTLKLLWEDEWRGLGITQSLGWEHYEVHEPEPHILLFK